MKKTDELLLDAALSIFHEKGYHLTRVSDIVKQAGVSQGTFYLYFKSKEEIYAKLVDQFLERILLSLEELSIQLEPLDDVDGKKELIYHTFRFFYENRKMANLTFTNQVETPSINEIIEQRDQAIVAFIKKVIRSSEPYNQFSDEELDIAASGIHAMFIHLNYKWFNEDSVDERYIDLLAGVVFRMIM
ncbi:TetR/AcrR family transcriptional regulator [Bacillus solimangrovi]|uniref:HTH tetR-type domain-containing protein n=1 Tax=Bacillus solimangrovi TaxID=1305675 RepID=A0A1E5LEU0_9BACI|nr:TetR/AcrR family transcriptional regulator [Bacillus solimangrovi]OEH92588.1 hypothetical protein BFG57_14995 [Bacillus solimangrovi]